MEKVERYKCDHCPKVLTKSAMRRHEPKCFKNPESRSCITCMHFDNSIENRQCLKTNESDSEAMVKIKQFMQAYSISNIYMRMLKVSELLPIQGFPKDYILKGSDTDKKKFIGNAVEVNVAAAWTSALACA